MFDSMDEEDTWPGLPSPEVMVAGTLALMTSWADPCPNAPLGLQQQRSLLARKVASNLFFLREHPRLSPAMRQIIAQVQQRWLVLARSAPDQATGAGAKQAIAPGLH